MRIENSGRFREALSRFRVNWLSRITHNPCSTLSYLVLVVCCLYRALPLSSVVASALISMDSIPPTCATDSFRMPSFSHALVAAVVASVSGQHSKMAIYNVAVRLFASRRNQPQAKEEDARKTIFLIFPFRPVARHNSGLSGRLGGMGGFQEQLAAKRQV